MYRRIELLGAARQRAAVGDGFVMVRYDNGFAYDTGVHEIDSERPPTEVVDDVIQVAHRGAARPVVV